MYQFDNELNPVTKFFIH